MPQQILYGVGKSILRDFVDLSKIIALSQLKNVTVSATANEEKLTGGDNPYPLATFQKDKAITISAESTTFSMNMLNITQGANISTGSVVFDDVENLVIPSDGQISLPQGTKVVANSVSVEGYTKAVDLVSLATGQYFQDTTDPSLVHFATADAGKEVTIVFQWNTDATAETLSVLKDTMAKPFKFIHRIPIYDNNSQIVAEGQLVVFKAQAKNNFEFNLQYQTAFAPKIELEALDPKRPDKKLWDFTIAPK